MYEYYTYRILTQCVQYNVQYIPVQYRYSTRTCTVNLHVHVQYSTCTCTVQYSTTVFISCTEYSRSRSSIRISSYGQQQAPLDAAVCRSDGTVGSSTLRWRSLAAKGPPLRSANAPLGQEARRSSPFQVELCCPIRAAPESRPAISRGAGHESVRTHPEARHAS